MQKQKEYLVAESNLANFGTELETNIKKAAAETEDAWVGAGKVPGLQAWRVVNFAVEKLDKFDGEFYEGDSYIVLKTYKKKDSDALGFDIHFWLGSTTTMDEAGTAAYKTVELDTLLDDRPVQHREVADHESHLFLSYFKEFGGIRILEGGAESGFNHVTPTEYRPRLLQLKGRKYIRIKEVPKARASLNSGDVFILDAGLVLYQWNGSRAGAREKGRAAQLSRAIDDERGGKPNIVVLEEGDGDTDGDPFWEALGGRGEIKPKHEGGDDAEWETNNTKVLYQMSDASGEHEFKKIAEGKIDRDMLHSDDAFVFDAGHEVFVYIGKHASAEERKHAMSYAFEYLKSSGRPLFLPVTLCFEGGDNRVFESCFD